jgi:hypothetical protein
MFDFDYIYITNFIKMLIKLNGLYVQDSDFDNK